MLTHECLAEKFKTYGSGEVGVGVDVGSGNVVLLGKAFHLVNEGNDGLEFLVGLAQGGLELSVGIDQALDLVQGVHDEHVDQVLTGAIQPVVKGLEFNKNNHHQGCS